MAMLGALATLLLSVTLFAGCARRGETVEDETDYRTAEVALEVENHNWSDVVIYLTRGNLSRRLGMVTALSTKHFVFNYRELGPSGGNRLRANPIGGRDSYTSDDLLLQPGQILKLTLESDLSRSYLGVY
jgi:hypothetical protein